MAFSKGTHSTEADFKRYAGIATVAVVGINPTLEELNKIYGKTFTEEPKYIDKDDNGNDRVRIDFFLKTDAEKHLKEDGTPLDMITKLSLYLSDLPRLNSSATKSQIIDIYGNTAWATPEEISDNAVPQYANGPANIAKYKQAYVGEENLVKFLKAFIDIPDPMTYNKNTKVWSWKSADELALCTAGLDHIADYFKGDFSELKNIISFQPDNRVKVLIGIKTVSSGAMYPSVYNGLFCKTSNANVIAAFKKDVEAAKSRGSLTTTDFIFADLREYVVNATDLSATPETKEENPFG